MPTLATATPFGSGALSLSFATNGSSNPTPKYLYLANSGTINVTAATLSATVSPSAVTNLVLTACSTTWTTSGNSCSGTTTTLLTLGTTSGSATISDVPTSAGSKISVQAKFTAAISATTTVTVGTTVTRAQARAAATTNS